MLRENAQVQPHKAEITETTNGDGLSRISDEAPVIGVERRA